MEILAITFFNWAVMLALGWPFLVVGEGILAAGSDVVGTGDWPNGAGTACWPEEGGTAGSGWLGLTTGAVGL